PRRCHRWDRRQYRAEAATPLRPDRQGATMQSRSRPLCLRAWWRRDRRTCATAFCRACGWSWRISYLGQGEQWLWGMLRLSWLRTNRPPRRRHCGPTKNVLGLGIIQSSRFSSRRADAREKRPARWIAGGEALFQAFVDLVFGRRSSQHLRLALAPRTR